MNENVIPYAFNILKFHASGGLLLIYHRHRKHFLVIQCFVQNYVTKMFLSKLSY